MEILALITGIIKLIPVIKDAFEKLVAYYVSTEIESMRKENTAAIELAMLKRDQRKIEEALGSNNAGKPVDQAGSEIRSFIVGVPTDE